MRFGLVSFRFIPNRIGHNQIVCNENIEEDFFGLSFFEES